MARASLTFFIALFAFALFGCGGGGSAASSGTDPTAIVEGVSTELVPPEDADANRDLVPPTFITIPPGNGGGSGPIADWTFWPESLANNVLDENNLYTSTEQALSWPENGSGLYANRSDCSGFVTRSLMKAFAFSSEGIKTWMGSTGPTSARYHDNILAANNFQRIELASSVKRGDIVAIQYLDKTSGGTGHTMIAASAPILRSQATKPIIENTVQYELRIIDSTSSPHGTGDTRKGTAADGSGSDQNGAGLGTMRLYADAGTHQIVGYTWSLSTGSSYYTAASPADDRRSLVVGRLTFAQ